MTPPATAPDMSVLTSYGIQPADEGLHPHSPDEPWWNESWFLDWFNDDGSQAGHMRIGLHPNQDRAFIWVAIYEDDAWTLLEEPRLALDLVDTDRLAGDSFGFRFEWDRSDALRSGRLRAGGHGRIMTGPRSGMTAPFTIDLAYTAAGAAHSGGPSDVEGHSAEGYVANRFEQPVSLEGIVGLGGGRPFVGRGERDHSWGPRPWNMEWLFVVVGSATQRMQWAIVDIPGLDRIATGYLLRDGTSTITEIDSGLEYGDDDLDDPVHGPFTVTTEDGTVVSGTVESIAGVELDISHCFDPPTTSCYRRTVARFTLDGDEPAIGWIERNTFGDAGPPG